MTKKVTNEIKMEEQEAQTESSSVKYIKKDKVKTVVYCGPTIKGVLLEYAHFTQGIPKKIKEFTATHKNVARLIVPLENFVETKKNIKTPGTIENLTYNKVLKGE